MRKIIFSPLPELVELTTCYGDRVRINEKKIPIPHPVLGSLVALCMVALVPLVLFPMGLFALPLSFLLVGALLLLSSFFVEIVLDREFTLLHPRDSVYQYRFSSYLDSSELKELNKIDKKWVKRLLALTKLTYRASTLGMGSELEDSMKEFNDYTKELRKTIKQKKETSLSKEENRKNNLKRREAELVLRDIKRFKRRR